MDIDIDTNKPRIVCQFSCGAASAVATKLILAEYPKERVAIVNAFILEEHEDNRRFLADCERWFDHPITVLRDEKYGASTMEVWRRRRFMKGKSGAPCSGALKRDVLKAFARPDDIYAVGYTTEEEDRYNRFIDANNGRRVLAPLIDRGLSKGDCLGMIERAGIELPMMYRLGFNNANCLCPKGGMGYWNHVRKVFPAEFVQIADLQESIGPGAYFFHDPKTNGRIGLHQLDPAAGRHDEPEIECGLWCELAERDIEGGVL